MNKKAISPVVATALLIVVSVIAVVGFQSWFGTYSSSMFVKTEQESASTSQIGIETLVGDQLYFKNTLLENITITQIKIGNRECNISQNISTGVHPISLGDCVNNLTLDSSIGDIVVITDKQIFAKKHLFKNITISVQESLTPSGSGNYFGDGSDGDIKVNSSGVYQDLGSGYQLHPNTTGTQWNSVQDGDMVVINARNFIVETGVTFTTTNRCRGLMIYTTGDMTVNGTISMTARGAHANPADSTSTVNTPEAPSDGNAVPVEGLVIRRIKSNWSDIDAGIISNAHASSLQDFNGTHNFSNLFYGAGLKAVNSESNQADVENGLVIKIPRVGGSGGEGRTAGNVGGLPGYSGSILKFATGGGGGGGTYGNSEGTGISTKGGFGTCFSGGVGGGSTVITISNLPGSNYGGNGGCGMVNGGQYLGTGGTGNSGGVTCSGSPYNAIEGNSGTGSLLLIFVKNNFNLNGDIKSEGTNSSWGSLSHSTGGASGGGIIGIFYGNNLNLNENLNVNGGIGVIPAILGGAQYGTGGAGGQGSIIGPIKIDP